MAYHLQAWRENKRLLRFRSLNACHKTFLSGSKISDCPGNYLGSKGKCSNSFDTFFHAFGYNTRDFFFFKQRKRETAPNRYNVIYFKVFGAVVSSLLHYCWPKIYKVSYLNWILSHLWFQQMCGISEHAIYRKCNYYWLVCHSASDVILLQPTEVNLHYSLLLTQEILCILFTLF